MAKYYHVRISNKKNPKNDYKYFMDSIRVKNEAAWDKDCYNKIKIGDYVGNDVNIFKVKEETVRENHWEKNNPYTLGNGRGPVQNRNGIILTNIHSVPKVLEWKKIKESINFAPNNPSLMPRGMQVVKNKCLLSFNI
jgi:hypothetical protein